MWWHREFEIPAELEKAFEHSDQTDMFGHIMRIAGKPFRNVPGRKTSQINLLNNSYFIKQHFGVGWQEIVKNLLSLKTPILGAMTEVNAIRKLMDLGIATTPLVAYGQRGYNPATLQSFVMTEDLGDIVSLEDLCADWKASPPSALFKQQLIIAVAQLANTLHRNGINHRDFYLCHICIDRSAIGKTDQPIKLYVIDLHRVSIHQQPSRKGNIKDMAALYFSSMDIGLNESDYTLFLQHYQNMDSQFWQTVRTRAEHLYRKFHSKKFQAKLAAEQDQLK